MKIDHKITADQRAWLEKTKTLLAKCGEPHTDDDAWRIQDSYDYIMLMTKLCNRYGITWEIRYEDGMHTVRAYKLIDNDYHKALIVDVLVTPSGTPRLCDAIERLIATVYTTWKPIERGNVLNMQEFRK